MIVSYFDIGKLNFSFYIEKFSEELIKDITNISLQKRYNTDGTPTSEFKKILLSIYTNGEKILLSNNDLTENTDKTKYFDFDIIYNLVDLLNEYNDYWDTVDYFVIERQMDFGKKRNPMALKLSHHCEAYFVNRYHRFKPVIEFEAFHKTHTLGAQKTKTSTKTGRITYKNMGDRERKKWAIEQAIYILSVREDYETVLEISNLKKKDDVSDVICMAQAFKYIFFCNKNEYITDVSS